MSELSLSEEIRKEVAPTSLRRTEWADRAEALERDTLTPDQARVVLADVQMAAATHKQCDERCSRRGEAIPVLRRIADQGSSERCERCEGTGRTYCSDRDYCGRRCCVCGTCGGSGIADQGGQDG